MTAEWRSEYSEGKRPANVWGQAFQIKGTTRAKGRGQEVGASGQITWGVGNHLCSVWWESLETREAQDYSHILKGSHWLPCGEQAKGQAWKKEHHTGGYCSHQWQRWGEQGRKYQLMRFRICLIGRANKICWWQIWQSDVECERQESMTRVFAPNQMVGPVTQIG